MIHRIFCWFSCINLKSVIKFLRTYSTEAISTSFMSWSQFLVGVSPLWQTPSLTSDPHDPYTVGKLSMRRTIWYPTHGHRTWPDPNRPDPNPCPDTTESYIVGKVSMWGVQRYHSHDPPRPLTYNNKRRNDTLEESQYPLTGMFRKPTPSIWLNYPDCT